MPTRNINLTESLDNFVESAVAKGQFQNASEVVRAALRSLQEKEENRAEWLAYLRKEAVEGFAELEAGKSQRGTPADLMAGVGREVSERIEKSWPQSSSASKRASK